MLTIFIAFNGQTRAHSPQARQANGSVIGAENGSSCLSNLEGHASAAEHIPFSHASGRHFWKSTSATFLDIFSFVFFEAHGFNSRNLRWGVYTPHLPRTLY